MFVLQYVLFQLSDATKLPNVMLFLFTLLILTILFKRFLKAWCTTHGREGKEQDRKGRRLRHVNKYNNTQLTKVSGTTRL
jgi:hypothetical protein